MAINGSDKSFAFMEFPLSMSRQDAFPLDKNSVFYSMSDAQTYAQTNPTAYVGQVIAVVEGGVSPSTMIRTPPASGSSRHPETLKATWTPSWMTASPLTAKSLR